MLESLEKTRWTPAAAAHLLSRAGFGGPPDAVLELHAKGLDRAVDSLLYAGEDSDLFPAPSASTPQGAMTMDMKAAGSSEAEKKAAMEEMKKRMREELAELRSWWVNRMRWSPFPAREKAVLFWHGHWATSVEKVKSPHAMWRQNEMLRFHALGKFEPMARDISRDPAMMRYLDLLQSKRAQPNENFARELMELFTLGEGQYTETDIRESARAFTGYRLDPANQEFRFAASQHDDGIKSVFGFEGKFNGDDIIAFLASNPQCARFLCRKIWTFYASDNASPELVEALAGVYRASNLNMSELLGTIFRSHEFYSPGVVRNQIKSPAQWLVQAGKELEVPLPGESGGILAQLGQNLFAPPNVKGWDGGRSWISSATLLMRYNLAGRIVRGGKTDDERILPAPLNAQRAFDQIVNRLFQFSSEEGLREKFLTFISANPTGKNVRRDVIHLMMSTPEYQLT